MSVGRNIWDTELWQSSNCQRSWLREANKGCTHDKTPNAHTNVAQTQMRANMKDVENKMPIRLPEASVVFPSQSAQCAYSGNETQLSSAMHTPSVNTIHARHQKQLGGRWQCIDVYKREDGRFYFFPSKSLNTTRNQITKVRISNWKGMHWECKRKLQCHVGNRAIELIFDNAARTSTLSDGQAQT